MPFGQFFAPTGNEKVGFCERRAGSAAALSAPIGAVLRIDYFASHQRRAADHAVDRSVLECDGKRNERCSRNWCGN
jgi:hypothetical protein